MSAIVRFFTDVNGKQVGYLTSGYHTDLISTRPDVFRLTSPIKGRIYRERVIFGKNLTVISEGNDHLIVSPLRGIIVDMANIKIPGYFFVMIETVYGTRDYFRGIFSAEEVKGVLDKYYPEGEQE